MADYFLAAEGREAPRRTTTRTSRRCRRRDLGRSRHRGAALGPLRPLLREHERVARRARGRARARSRRCCEAADGAEGLLLVGDRRRAPRTALPGPFLDRPVGRPCRRAGCPTSAPGSRSSPGRRRASSAGRGPPGPLAVLGQWEPRYLQLAGRLEANLAGGGAPPFPVLRWTSERITRADLVRGPAARARRRHLLRPRPAVGLGRLPRAARRAISSRRPASRSARSSRSRA